MAPSFFRRWLTDLGVLTSRPAAFILFALYALAWIVFSPETLEWHGIATLGTWFMTLLIQRAEHRDTQAIHVKLDELLRIHGDARNELTRVDEEDAEEVEQERKRVHAGAT
jgi:low affinity Fe/Cu permease